MRLQQRVGLPLFHAYRHLTFSELNVEGRLAKEPERPTIFISSHDSIVGEPIILNYLRRRANLPNASLIAGDNLFRNPILRFLIKFEEVIEAPRGKGKGRDLASRIKEETDKGKDAWVAQSKGRSKDGHHKTVGPLLKNLVNVYGSPEELSDAVIIQPFTFSTEYDPAGPALAAWKRDFYSTLASFLGWKGKAKAVFCPVLQDNLFPAEMKWALDAAIQANYTIFETHRQAYEERSSHPQEQWKTAPVDTAYFTSKRFKKQIASLEPDQASRFVARYAVPVVEKIAAMEQLKIVS